jgi:hypothetical protein
LRSASTYGLAYFLRRNFVVLTVLLDIYVYRDWVNKFGSTAVTVDA